MHRAEPCTLYAADLTAGNVKRRSSLVLLWLFLAVALFTRAFLPQGYMPEQSQSGTVAVTLCSSGAVHLVPLKEGTAPGEEPLRAELPCAFAGLALAAVPTPILPELPHPVTADATYGDRAPTRVPTEAQHLRPPARAPPLAA